MLTENVYVVVQIFLIGKFSNKFKFSFPLSYIHSHILRQRKTKIKLVKKIREAKKKLNHNIYTFFCINYMGPHTVHILSKLIFIIHM